MGIWTIVLLVVLGLLPILIGARFRALKDKNEKYVTVGSLIQTVAALNMCILVVGEIIKSTIAFYVTLGIVLIIYIITLVYIYLKFVKK